jgi:hypothetical protein
VRGLEDREGKTAQRLVGVGLAQKVERMVNPVADAPAACQLEGLGVADRKGEIHECNS